MSDTLYHVYKNATKGIEMPFLLLDKELLDANIQAIIKRASGKAIRIATKSIRSAAIIKLILQSSSQFIGLMSYSATETLHLLDQDFDHILLGYPITNKKHIFQLCEKIALGANVTFMVDSLEQVELIQEQAMKFDIKAPICIDIDMSSKFPFIYFGVYRSSIKNIHNFKKFIQQIKNFQNIAIHGIMGYEAQIAGIADNVKGHWFINSIISYLKKQSIKELAKRRKACYDYLVNEGIVLKIVNGGGTGSIESTKQESEINEITVGSGFFNSHLFDGYSNFKHHPALVYAIECTRKPLPDKITCSYGGYIASGSIGFNKQSIPYLPTGLKLIQDEGTGEVQTPFDITACNEQIQLGDPIFMRHSKAGEICERFNHIQVLIDKKNIITVNTYRGNGKCFG